MYSEVIKNRAIVHYKYFLKSIRKVAACYKIGKSTLSRWLKKDGIEISRKKRATVLDRINPFVADLLAANPFLTTKMLSKEVHKALSLKVSSSTCSRSVHYNNFSYKRTRLQVRKGSYSEIESSFKQAYLQAKKMVSIDETFFYYNEYPRYGYSKKGKQLKHAIKDNPKRKKLTLYMAVDQDRIIGYKLGI